MAGYSENREYNLEIKYLRKVLADVDSRVVLPGSLRGEALLQRLEGVRQDAPPMGRTLMLPRNLLSVRSGFAYAAAFLLIVGLFYGLGFDQRNDLVDGAIPIEPRAVQEAIAGEGQGDAVFLGEPAPSLDRGGPVTGGSGPAAKSPADFGVFMLPNPGDGGAVGQSDANWLEPEQGQGGILAAQIATYGEYTLCLRPNEDGDPDHMAAAPHVLEIIDPDDNRVVSQIDVPQITLVKQTFLLGDRVVLVGKTKQGISIFGASLEDISQPQATAFLEQPGTLVDAQAYGDIVHVVTYGGEALPGVTQISLPDSGEAGVCTFTAMDVAQGVCNQAAFLGAGEKIRLMGAYAFLYYSGETPEESGKDDFFIAQVKLSGLDIELGNIS